VQHHTIDANGLQFRYVEHGEGQPVVMLHGFPESWSTWRAQMVALADAGYRAIAPDMRGYGGTDAPDHPSLYSTIHHVGDVVALIDHIGGPVVLIGHDWGAPQAWNTAVLRPDLVRAVIGMSVPFLPPMRGNTLEFMDAIHGGPYHYQRWFQTDASEAEVMADVRRFIVTFYDALSGHHGRPHTLGMSEGQTLLEALSTYGEQPPWLSDEHLDELVQSFTDHGIKGGLNWYRAAPYNVDATRPWNMRNLQVPAAYVTGDLDVVYRWAGMADVVAALPALTPKHLGTLIIPGCGHWTSEERPDEVNAFLLDVLARL
jgi:pimeloyl-ACP methyl ester carboxylesterase